MRTLSEYSPKKFIGKVDGKSIYLSAPSWDCDWYWGFGYLGNNNIHYHIDGIDKDVNLHDAIVNHFDEGTFIVKDNHDIYTLAELFKTFYTLKETAEVLGRGGSHITDNPLKHVIVNKDEVTRINQVVLPAIFEAIYDILDKNN